VGAIFECFDLLGLGGYSGVAPLKSFEVGFAFGTPLWDLSLVRVVLGILFFDFHVDNGLSSGLHLLSFLLVFFALVLC